MRAFLILIGLLCIASVSAATYYVDGTNGNDLNTGLSTSTAFRTIARANTIHAGGDTVYILPGTYREMMFPKTGTGNTPTVYAGYGNNRSKVIISGSEKITGWTQYSGNVWVANLPDTQKRCEAYDSLSTPGAIACSTDNGRDFCIVNSADCFEDTSKWYMRADLSGSNFLSGATPALVNASGKYYIDRVARKVYVWTFDNQSPNAHTIECSARTVLPLMTGGGNDLDGQPPYSNYWPSGYSMPSNFKIENMTIMHSYRNALVVGLGENITINNNEIMYNSGGATCSANPAAIIHHATCGTAHWSWPMPANCYAQGFVVSNNSIHDQGSDAGPINTGTFSGGQGIEFYDTGNAFIIGNEIYNVNNAVYPKAGNNHTFIINNNIYNYSLGILTQLNVYYNIIEGNTISYNFGGEDRAIYIQAPTGGNVFINNVIYENPNDAALVATGGSGATNINTITFKNNIVLNSLKEIKIASSYGDASINDSDYNIFYDPKYNGFFADVYYCSGTSFANWRTCTNNDMHSNVVDPLLVDPAHFNFALQPTSPAIDAGIFIQEYHCALSDENGGTTLQNCRHWCGLAPDIGAKEYCPATAGCSLPYDQPTCNCINSTELNNAIQGWYKDNINIPQLMQTIKQWKICSG